MVDINLLPDEFRAKEEKEKEAAKKIPRVFEVKLSAPPTEKVAKTEKPKLSHGFFSKFVSKKEKPAIAKPAPLLSAPPRRPPPVQEEKVEFYPPKLQVKKPKTQATLSGEDILAEIKKPATLKPPPKIEMPNSFSENKLIAPQKEEKIEVAASSPRPFTFLSRLKSIFYLLPKFRRKAKLPAPLKTSPPKILKRLKKKKLEINLIPEELAKHPEYDFGKRIVVIFLVISTSILIIFSLREFVELRQIDIKSKISEVEQKTLILKSKINEIAYVRADALKLREKMALIEDLLNFHLYWTRIFTALERYTVDEVYYNNFSADQEGNLILSAVGKDYKALARQLVAFQKAPQLVEDVSITSASAEVDKAGQVVSISFDITLKLVKDSFFIQY